MKKILFFLLFITGMAQAQIVNIPDANFKAKLLQSSATYPYNVIGYDLNWNPIIIDVNSDGEIQVSEALIVYHLNVRLSNISSLTGIEAFSNLQSLNCQWNLLTTLDTSGLVNLTSLTASRCALTSLNANGSPNLTSLDCTYNALNSLNVSSLTNLTSLWCGNNQLTGLDVSALTNLTQLGCSNNMLTSLNISGLSNILGLSCENNLLNTLDIGNLSNLAYLSFGNPGLSAVDVNTHLNLVSLHFYGGLQTSMDISNLTNLEYLTFSGTNLTSIDASQNGVIGEFSINNNPDLTYVNIKDGVVNGASIANCINLVNICADENEIVSVRNALVIEGGNNPSTVVTSYCSFTPGGDYNTITGNVIYDLANDGCDVADLPQPFIKVKINDGTTEGASFVDLAGMYKFYTQAGNFTVTPDVENPSFFNFSPPNTVVNFPDNNNHVVTQNFCITANGVHPDLEIVIAPVIPARPGFNAVYKIVYKNKGNQVLSQPYGINFFYNQNLLTFVSATQLPDSQNAGAMNWNYSNLMPFESRIMEVTMHVNTPTDANPVNSGDVLQLTASILPMAGDETTQDNLFQLNQTVLNSYDPNDKYCLEGEVESPVKIGDYLHYIINFENIGTADAINVVVKDVIDTAKFDEKSLQVLSSSHPVEAKISGNVAEFVFQNINLTTTGNGGGGGGHGNILLKIKTRANLAIGDVVTNKADIFFDYNAPIVTNLASTVFQSLSVDEHTVDTSVAVYPNPTSNSINIKSNNAIKSIQLFDVQGRLLFTRIAGEVTETVDLSTKAAGVYFMRIMTTQGIKIEKILKK